MRNPKTMAESELSGAGPFSVPGQVAIDRSAEGQRVTEFLSDPQYRLAVLYGQRASGKTSLILDLVIPAISHTRRVFYGRCAPDIPERVAMGGDQAGLEEALAAGAIVFVDDFEQFLLLPEKARVSDAVATFARLEKGELRGTLVLVVCEENLSHLLSLRSVAPSLLERTLEITPVSFRDTLERLSQSRSASGANYQQEAIELLNAECEKSEWKGDLDFIQAVDAGFQRFKANSADPLITVADSKAIGGIQGALQEYYQDRLQIPVQRLGPDAEPVADAVIEEIVDAARTARTPDFTDLPARLGVSEGFFGDVFECLKSEARVVKAAGNDGFDLVPHELIRVVGRQIEPRWQQTHEIARMLSNALRSKQQLGVLLPRDRFDQVERFRTWLRTTDDEAALLVLTVLHSENDANADRARYWLARIRSGETRVSVLMEALFSEAPRVRADAAALLAAFDEPEVRGQLYRTALEDPEAEVRVQAVASLSRMQTSELWPLLEKEAQDSKSPYQEHAVAAMRLWKDAKCAKVLQALVSDPQAAARLREIAIHTLAAIETTSAVDALVDISLNDDDAEDRVAAAAALASIPSEPLITDALASLRTSRLKLEQLEPLTFSRVLSVLPKVVLALAVVIGNVVLNGLALLPFGRIRLAALFFAVQVVAILLYFFGASSALALEPAAVAVVLYLVNCAGSQLLATRAALAVGKDGLRFRLPRVLGTVLFVCCLPIFLTIHGSAHALMNKWRRGLRLLFLEALGVLCFVIGNSYFGSRDIGRVSDQALLIFYMSAGVALFATAFLADVIPIFYGRFLQASRGQARHRRDAVLSVLVAKTPATKLVLNSALEQDREGTQWARKIVRRFAGVMRPQEFVNALSRMGGRVPGFLRKSLAQLKSDEGVEALDRLWDESPNRAVRRLLVRVLAARPTERSLEALALRWRQLEWSGKARFKLASWYYRLRLWPITSILAVLLVLPLAGYAWNEFSKGRDNPAWGQIQKLREYVYRVDDEKAIKTAKFLAEVYPEESADELLAIFTRENLDSNRSKLKTGIAESVATVACSSEGDAKARAMKGLVSAFSQRRPETASALHYIEEKQCYVAKAESSQLTEKAVKILGRGDAPQEEVPLALAAIRATGVPAADTRSSVIGALQAFALRERTEPRIRWKDIDVARGQREAVAELLRLRGEAVEALIWIGGDDAVPALRDIAEKASAPELRRKASLSISALDPLNNIQMAFNTADYQRVLNEGKRIDATRLRLSERVTILSLLAQASFHLSQEDRGARQDQLEQDAIAYFKKARMISDGPVLKRSLAEVYDSRAQRFLSSGYIEPALKESLQAIQADPEFGRAYSSKGSILYQMGRKEEALREFRLAIRWSNSNESWPLCMAALIRLEREEFDEAVSLSRSAIDADPDYSWSYSLLRESYTKAGKAREAIAVFENLKERHAKAYWPGRELAYLDHEYSTDPGRFERVYKLYVELDKQFGATLDQTTLTNLQANFFEAQFTAGRYDEVLESGNRIRQRLPESDVDLRIPVTLIMYVAAVLSGGSRAPALLNELDAAITKLPNTYVSSWNYQGTISYLKTQKIATERAAPLLGLLEAADRLQKKEPIPRSVIDANRAALRGAGAKE